MGIIKDSLYNIANKRFLPFFKNQSVFPYYHLVRDNKVPHIENLYPYKNIAQFRKDIDVLLKNYNAVNPEYLLKNKAMPNNSFLLSFDDGLEEIYSVIFPILKEKKIKALFFINPNFVDNKESLYKHDISLIINHLSQIDYNLEIVQKIASLFDIKYNSNVDFINKFKNIRFSEKHKIKEVLNLLNINIEDYLREKKPYVTKEQIKEMMEDGQLFGGHTMSHPPLKQLAFEEQKKEIIDSIEWLKINFGIEYSLFSFPFSDKGVAKKLLKELFGYDNKILLFGNSGLKKDIDERLIQRFSLENPNKDTQKQIVTENLYKIYNKFIGKYHIRRND
ncbi:polysaccharide deacetylase family protein [Flavobacterium sp.]|uniref:polysaccharide deacetylase family protein n=1 Tax=Flavobacterium sp. TaxID=239 RepID=UPI002639ED3C|nr:polysaccharide deacetylase family protein [Flavobacterium sp.]